MALRRQCARPERTSRLAWLDTGLLGAGLLLLLTLPGNRGGDGRVRYEALQTLLSGDLPDERYSLVTPALATPLAVLGRLVGAEEAFAYRLNGVLFAAGVIAIWLLLRETVSSSLIRSFLLVLVFGSMFPASVVTLYGETATAMLLAVGLLAVVGAPRPGVRLLGWFAAILGVVNTPAVLPAFALAVAVLALGKRKLWPLLSIVVAMSLILIDTRLHTGSFGSPYADDHGFATVLPFSGRPGFSYPALFGLLAIVFSLGKGLLFFAPGLFLGVGNRLADAISLVRTRWLWLLLVAGLIAVYCRWWAWYGGEFFGPRFFLFASVPASLALAARLRPGERSLGSAVISLAALGLSFWVGFTAALPALTPTICTQDGYALEHLCWYTPEFSALWRPFFVLPDLSTQVVAFATLSSCVFLRLAVPLVMDTCPLVTARIGGLVRAVRTGERW